MPKIIYDFGGVHKRTREVHAVDLAIMLAVARYGSDKAVCAVLKISRNVLARWRADTVPRRANLEALAKAAEIPSDWLTLS